MPYRQPTLASLHRKPRDREYQRQYDRGRADDHGFYASARWRAVRLLVLERDPLCVECLRFERITPAVDVDHIQERLQRPDLAYELSNLRGLCHSCHSRHTHRTHTV